MKIEVLEEALLLDFIIEKFNMPKKRASQYLKHGSIYVNNNKETKYNLALHPKDVVAINFKNKNSTLPFDILY